MPNFEIISFEGALPLRFGMSPADVAGILGLPRTAAANWQHTLCYDYWSPILSLSIGFGSTDQTADHFAFGRGSTVYYQGLDFFSNRSAWRTLVELSSDYHECLGFLVFCDLGIALSGFHDDDEDDLAVTVFPLGAWEKFRPKFMSFRHT